MIYVYKDDVCPRGLFAYVWTVLDTIRKLEPEDLLYVDLTTGIPTYYDPNYTRTNNVWDYYFQQPFNLTEDCYNSEHKIYYYNGEEVGTTFIFGIKNGKYRLAHTTKIRAEGKRLVDKYIRFQPHILTKVEDFYSANIKNKNVVGVHIRGGSMYTSNPGSHGHGDWYPELGQTEYYYPFVDAELEHHDAVFLMANNLDSREKFKARYGNRLLHYDSDLLSDGPVDLTWLHNDRNYEKGEVAVIEILLLNHCNKMLLTSSNIGLFATLYGNTQYQYLDEHVQVHY